MKIFQPQYRSMDGKSVTLDHVSGFPDEIYPNTPDYGYHDFYELEYFAKGEGEHFINGISFPVKPGYVYLLIPGDIHRMQLDTDKEFELWNLKIAVDVPDKELAEELGDFPRPLCAYLHSEMADFFQNELFFLDDCLHHNAWNFKMSKNSAERLLAVVHHALEKNGRVEVVHESGTVSKIIKYVEKNYPKNITLKQIAEQLRLSEGYAGIYFKKHTGIYFNEYLNRIRLFHVMRLLRESNHTIKEISFEVGFSSPEYLTRLFTSTFGLSPSSYRKNSGI